MQPKVIVFDPTVTDKQSKVRGIGRYLQVLKENFSKEFTFTNDLKSTSRDSIFINSFFNFLQPPLLMKKVAYKQIAVIHDLIPLKYPSHFPIGIKGTINVYLNKLALRNYDLIVTDSEASKKDIVNILHVENNKVKVIYPILPQIFTNLEFRIHNSESKILNSQFHSKFSILNSRFCLYVGDATWNKNLVNLAKAIKILNVTCVFVGNVFNFNNQKAKMPVLNDLRGAQGWQQELHDFYQEIKDDKRFILLGYIPDVELINLYQHARCNILVSRDEGFGFSFLEASSQSCPSVLSDIPVLHEISADSVLFCDPSNPHSIADKIKEIYFNDEVKKTFGDKAKKRVDYFSKNHFREQWLNSSCMAIIKRR